MSPDVSVILIGDLKTLVAATGVVRKKTCTVIYTRAKIKFDGKKL